MKETQLAKYCPESGVARISRPNAQGKQPNYVNTNPFPFSSVNQDSPCFGFSYWDTRALISHVKGRELAVEIAEEKIGKQVDWEKIEFISTETTAGVPFATWMAEKKELPLVVVADKPRPYDENTEIYSNPDRREQIKKLFVSENNDYDFVSTGTMEGIAFAALVAQETKKPMFYIREEPKTYGKNRQDRIDSQVEGLGDTSKVRGKKVLNVDAMLQIQPPNVTRLLSDLKAEVGDYRQIWGPKEPEDLEGKYGVHFTDLMTSGRSAKEAINKLREVGARIECCHFVIKRGDQDLKKENIRTGYNLHENEIISICHQQGLFTDEDVKRLKEFGENPRKYNRKFLRTEKGHDWIKSIGERGELIIRQGYPSLKGEYEIK